MAEESEAEEEMLHLTKTSESGESKVKVVKKREERVAKERGKLIVDYHIHEIIILMMMIIAWS